MKMTLKKLRNSAAALLCCAAVILSGAFPFSPAPLPAFAETQAELEKRISDNKAYIAELDGKIAAAQGEIAENEQLRDSYVRKLAASKEQVDLLNALIADKETQIARKEDEIAAKEQEISDKETEISETELRISDKETQTALLEQTNKKNLERFGEICASMYMNGSLENFSVLSGAESFFDIFVRSEIQKSVSEQNLRFANDIRSDIETLARDREELIAMRTELENAKERLKYEKDVLATSRSALLDDKEELYLQRSEADSLLAQYTADYNYVSAQIADLESLQAQYADKQQRSLAEIKDIEAQIDELIRQAQLAASNSVKYEDGEWAWPLDHKYNYISTYFGYDAPLNRYHRAVDIAGSGIMGSDIYASKAGEVIVAKTTYIPNYDYGMYIVIDHGDGYNTLYAHCSAVYVTVGQKVQQGDVIGAVGSTGYAFGPHLHFEMRVNGERVDPFGYVNIP